jgi:AcrR family transcriptional regulator
MSQDLKPSTAPAEAARRRTRRGEETRRALIDGTIRCLNSLGYAGTSIEAVMEETGISRGSVLNQFPTRVALMSAAIEAAMLAMVSDTRRRGAEIDDPVQRVREMCNVFWETQNIPEAVVVTEVLLAARWDGALAQALGPIANRIETEIDQYTLELIQAAGVDAAFYEHCLLHARILILSLRGITLELMYDKDRRIMHRALARIREMHLSQCDIILPAGR